MNRWMGRRFVKVGLWAVIGAVYLTPLLMVRGAADYFLKIGDIKGESVDQDHKEWIELSSFSFGVSNSITGAGSTRSVGPTRFEDVAVSKWIDKSSPILMLSTCEGRVFPKVEIEMRDTQDGTPTARYLKYELSDVLVSSVQSGGDAGPVPTESISLNFTKIEMSYSVVDRATGETNFTTNVTCNVDGTIP